MPGISYQTKPDLASGCQVNIKCFYAKSTCLGSNYRNISSLTLVQKVIPGYLQRTVDNYSWLTCVLFPMIFRMVFSSWELQLQVSFNNCYCWKSLRHEDSFDSFTYSWLISVRMEFIGRWYFVFLAKLFVLWIFIYVIVSWYYLSDPSSPFSEWLYDGSW
jgi:hypothetical protein